MSLFLHRALGHFLMNEAGGDSGGGALDVNGGAMAFAALLDPPVATEQPEGTTEHPEQPVEPEVEAELEEEAEPGESEEEPQTFTVKIDGKEVEVSLDELKNGYQRQSDYTKKTMEAAEQRKTADAETQKAQQERQQYAGELQRMAVQLEGVLEQQSQIDWSALIEADPVEYLKQRQLYEQRQALYQQNTQERQKLFQQHQHEQAQAHQSYLAEQQDNLLAKLPDWKDDAKAAAEKTAISKFLQEQGFGDEDISSIADHRHVLVARKAMLYDQLMAKANVQAKKVQEAPQRVVKPGVTSNGTPDGRTTAAKRHERNGTVETGAQVFRQFLD
jgi:thiol:disulfide interchange protein